MSLIVGKPVRRDDGRTNQWGLITGALLGALLGEIVFVYAAYQLQWTRLQETLLLNLLCIVLYSVAGIGIGLLIARNLNRLKGHLMVQQDSEPYLLGALWIFVVLNLYGHLSSPFKLLDVPYGRFPFADTFWTMLGWTVVKALLVVIVSGVFAFILYEVAIWIKPRPARKWTLKRKKRRKVPWISLLFGLSWPLLFFGILALNRVRISHESLQPTARPDRERDALLVVAWNQADWETMQPLLEQGRMPNLKALMDQGVYGQVRPASHPDPAAIWASLWTGESPSGHGVIGSPVFELGPFRESLLSLPVGTGLELALRVLSLTPLVEARPVAAHDRRSPAIWELANRQGDRTAVIGGSLATLDRLAQHLTMDRRVALPLDRLIGSATPEPILMEAARWVSPSDWVDRLRVLDETNRETLDEQFRRVARLSPEEWAELRSAPWPSDSNHPWAIFRNALAEDLLFIEAARRVLEENRPDFTLVFLDGLRQVQDRTWEYRHPEQAVPSFRVRPEKYGFLTDYYYDWLDEQLGGLSGSIASERKTVAVVSGFGRGGVFLPTGADPAASIWGQPGFFVLAGPLVASAPEPLPPVAGTDLVPILSHTMGLDWPERPLADAWKRRLLRSGPPISEPRIEQQSTGASPAVQSVTRTMP